MGLHCCGTTFVMLNPILNLPVLISHHKHPFTKQRIVEESGTGGLEADKATQGSPKWPTLDKTKASFTEPAQKENPKTKDNASPLIYCFHSPEAQGREQSPEQDRAKEEKKREEEEEGKRVEMSPPASIWLGYLAVAL